MLIMTVLLIAVGATLSVPPAKAILNGTETSWSDHSDLAKLEVVTDDGWAHWCGGTFLSDTWVLTAAHCVTNRVKAYGDCEYMLLDVFAQKDCYIYAQHGGDYYLDTPKMAAVSMRVTTAAGSHLGVAETFVHPAYQMVLKLDEPGWQPLPCLWTCAHVGDLKYVSWDFALIRLSKAATGVKHVQLLDDPSLLSPNLPVIALGWGDTNPGPDMSLSEELVTSQPGALKLSDQLAYPACDPTAAGVSAQSTVLCAVSQGDAGVGSGDSGGPWFATFADGRTLQVGLSSFGPAAFGAGETQYARVSHPDKIANVAAASKWIRSKTGITSGPGSSDDTIATTLIIDNSGSMSSNDPAALRRDAAIAYVNTAVPGDYVGAVGFESSAYDIAAMTQLPAGKEALTAALTLGVFAGGGTDIGAGLRRGCTMLDSTTLPTKRAAILLTDGDGGYSNEATCFAAKGWRIFTVGLGAGVNSSLLHQIATQTGGTYQPVPSAFQLQCRFQQVRALAAGGQSTPCDSEVIRPGETITKSVTVAPRQSQISFVTNWPGSDVEMSLVSPSGRVIDRASDAWDVTHSVAATHEEYVVQVPEPGAWTVRLFGTDVAPAGEPVVFGASPIPFDNQLPTITAASAAASTAGSYRFTAKASDPDGTVEQIVWNFGDGETGVGTDISHTYRVPGTYRPRVTAVDDDGEASTVDLAPIVVEGSTQPPTPSFTALLAGTRLSVDATGTQAPSGTKITRYGWDFDGDGTLDSESASPTATWTYTKSGAFNVTLVVEASNGLAATSSKTVDVRTMSGVTIIRAGTKSTVAVPVTISVAADGVIYRVRASGKSGGMTVSLVVTNPKRDAKGRCIKSAKNCGNQLVGALAFVDRKAGVRFAGVIHSASANSKTATGKATGLWKQKAKKSTMTTVRWSARR